MTKKQKTLVETIVRTNAAKALTESQNVIDKFSKKIYTLVEAHPEYAEVALKALTEEGVYPDVSEDLIKDYSDPLNAGPKVELADVETSPSKWTARKAMAKNLALKDLYRDIRDRDVPADIMEKIPASLHSAKHAVTGAIEDHPYLAGGGAALGGAAGLAALIAYLRSKKKKHA